MKNILKMCVRGIGGFMNKIKNGFDKILDFASLKMQIKILKKENEELRKKQRPYINKISVLTSQNRKYNLELIRARAEIERLQDTIKRYEDLYNYKEVGE